MRRHAIALMAGAALLVPAASEAQSLAARVDAARDGTVRFSFESKPGVCGDGESIAIIRDGETIMSHNRSYRKVDGRYEATQRECVEGPVQVELTKSNRAITDARVYVGGPPRRADTELGEVQGREAVEYMLAERTLAGAARKAADHLVFGATLSPVESWQQMLRVARNQELPESVRRSSIFWVSQIAGDRATQGLVSMIGDDSDELEVRKQAIFALSQIRGQDSVEALIRVARTSREPEIRKNAIFWLGQSKDPRVLAFFEEVLRG